MKYVRGTNTRCSIGCSENTFGFTETHFALCNTTTTTSLCNTALFQRCSTLLHRLLESSLPITCASLLLEPLVWLRFIVCPSPESWILAGGEWVCECVCVVCVCPRCLSIVCQNVVMTRLDSHQPRSRAGDWGLEASRQWEIENVAVRPASHVHNCILVTYDCTNLNSIMFYLCIAVLSSGKRNCMYFVWNWIMWPRSRRSTKTPNWLLRLFAQQFNLQFCNLKGHFSVR